MAIESLGLQSFFFAVVTTYVEYRYRLPFSGIEECREREGVKKGTSPPHAHIPISDERENIPDTAYLRAKDGILPKKVIFSSSLPGSHGKARVARIRQNWSLARGRGGRRRRRRRAWAEDQPKKPNPSIV